MSRWTWTQAVCDRCWEERQPGRVASRIIEAERDTEVCAYCGTETRSGIYMRADPATVPFPREADE